jgi:hypothetical protein
MTVCISGMNEFPVISLDETKCTPSKTAVRDLLSFEYDFRMVKNQMSYEVQTIYGQIVFCCGSDRKKTEIISRFGFTSLSIILKNLHYPFIMLIVFSHNKDRAYLLNQLKHRDGGLSISSPLSRNRSFKG